MNTLRVTSKWLNWFHKEAIEVVTTINNSEIFIKTYKGHIQGNYLNYTTLFQLIETTLDAFNFLKVDNIRLVWSEKLENNNLQFFKQNENFEIWKENIIKGNYEFENSFGGNYEDLTEIYYNYSVNTECGDFFLYTYNHKDRISIYIWYNPITGTTNYEINIELIKALFFIDENLEFLLPDNYIEQNKVLLAETENKITEKLKAI